MKNIKNVVKGLVICGYIVFALMLSGLIGYKAYIFMNTGNIYSNQVTVKQNIPEWQRVANLDSSRTTMLYKVDIDNNDKILEELCYSDAINRNDKDAWYCPIDLYQEEIEHINSKNDNSVVLFTPYFSHVSKILKQDYR